MASAATVNARVTIGASATVTDIAPVGLAPAVANPSIGQSPSVYNTGTGATAGAADVVVTRTITITAAGYATPVSLDLSGGSLTDDDNKAQSFALLKAIVIVGGSANDANMTLSGNLAAAVFGGTIPALKANSKLAREEPAGITVTNSSQDTLTFTRANAGTADAVVTLMLIGTSA